MASEQGFMPTFGDVWRDLVSPVLLYWGDTHCYAASVSTWACLHISYLPCTCRTAPAAAMPPWASRSWQLTPTALVW